jgi:hypothetical protein
VLSVELLERVVGEDGGAHLLGDAEQEGVAPPDGTGRRRHQLVVRHRLLERHSLRLVDAVAEGGVHDDGHHVVGVLTPVLAHSFVELGQAGHRAALGGDVGAVDDDVAG